MTPETKTEARERMSDHRFETSVKSSFETWGDLPGWLIKEAREARASEASLEAALSALRAEHQRVVAERDDARRDFAMVRERLAEAWKCTARHEAALAASEEKAREMAKLLNVAGEWIFSHPSDEPSGAMLNRFRLALGLAGDPVEAAKVRAALSPSPAPRVGAESEGPEDTWPSWEPEVPNFSDGDEASDE